MQTRFVILNGPPGSGKSTIARELARELVPDRRELNVRSGAEHAVVQDSFAAPMKHFIATALGDKYQDMDKERARPELNGSSVRRFLIDLAETHIKDCYGQDIFGRWLVHRVMRWPSRKPLFCIVDDGGFEPEFLAVPNRCLIKVHRDGKDFAGDSRGYIDRPSLLFTNNGDITNLYMNVKALAAIIRDGRGFTNAS